MMRVTQEQMMILNCYTGSKRKVIHEMELSLEELKNELNTESNTESDTESKTQSNTSEFTDPEAKAEMIWLMEDLLEQLRQCTNQEYFLAKKEGMIDEASDLDAEDVR